MEVQLRNCNYNGIMNGPFERGCHFTRNSQTIVSLSIDCEQRFWCANTNRMKSCNCLARFFPVFIGVTLALHCFALLCLVINTLEVRIECYYELHVGRSLFPIVTPFKETKHYRCWLAKHATYVTLTINITIATRLSPCIKEQYTMALRLWVWRRARVFV